MNPSSAPGLPFSVICLGDNYPDTGGLFRYRKYQKSRTEERLDKVVRLADQLGLPRAAVTGGDRPLPSLPTTTTGLNVRRTPFPEPTIETVYPNGLIARGAIADQLGRPIGAMSSVERAFIDELLAETLDKKTITVRIRERFQVRRREE